MTLADIISRYFDPKSGEVLIGGVDVRNIRSWQKMVPLRGWFLCRGKARDGLWRDGGIIDKNRKPPSVTSGVFYVLII